MNTKKPAPKKPKSGAVKKASTLSAKKIVAKGKISVAKKVSKPAAKKATQKTKAIASTKKTIAAKKVSSSIGCSLKRTTYMFLSILLGLLIGTFVSMFVELVYLKNADAAGIVLQAHSFCGLTSYLPSFAEPLFLLVGLIFGIWLGSWGWNTVYVQHRHRMFRK